MLLNELKEEYIRPLTRTEKWQLVKEIQEMLQQEETAEEQRILRNIFKPGVVYEVASPMHAPDDSDAKAAAQLQNLINSQSA